MLPPALTHLALLALVSVAGAVEQGELCQIEMNNIKGKLQANCTWLALSTVPSQLPKDTGILLLGSNHLASVSTSSFQYLPMLVDLDLSHNGLKSFHAGPPLLQLQELILSHNALGALPPLQGLPALLCLGLAHNSIKDLPLGAFRSLGNLKELDLKGNRLQRLPKDAFAGLAALQDLDLSNNALEELPLGLLTELESLDTLRLPGNRLRTVPTDFFPKNHSFPYSSQHPVAGCVHTSQRCNKQSWYLGQTLWESLVGVGCGSESGLGRRLLGSGDCDTISS
uniref:Uncharacterized protein n=1 Tax=Crocodylus porosus TaxID=8502 RepID=A0A7M4F3K5_CROPO